MLDDIDLSDCEPSLGANIGGKLRYHNVEISVRPEILTRHRDKKGRHFIGAIKLHFSTTHPFNEDMAGYVSAVVQEFVKTEHCLDGQIIGPPISFVIDTGSKKVFPGVKSTAKRLKDVAAECQNIAALWPTI